MKGRKPKPAAQQIAEGDPRKLGAKKLRAKLDAEPRATRGLPKCPDHVQGRARAAWKFWAEELESMQIDKRPDAMMLEGACVHYGRAVQADLIIADEGPVCTHVTVDPLTGRELQKLKAHPAIGISNSAWRQVRSFCSEFGLSPVSRTRLSIENTKRKQSTEEFMKALMSDDEPAKPTVQ